MVCFDQPTLNLLEEVASRYNRRQSLTVEGVPAVTKTFGIWVFAVVIGSPYYRVNMTPNSKDRAIYGGREPSGKRSLVVPLDELLGVDRDTEGIITNPNDELAGRPYLYLDPKAAEYAKQLRARHVQGQTIDLDEVDALGNFAGVNLVQRNEFEFVPSVWMKFLEKGGIVAVDERNVADPAIFEGALALFEAGLKRFNIPNSGLPPITRHPMYWAVSAQNQIEHGSDRFLSSKPSLSREEYVIVPPAPNKQSKTCLFSTSGVFIPKSTLGAGNFNTQAIFRPSFGTWRLKFPISLK